MFPTKIVNKGDVIIGRIVTKYKWMHEIRFEGEEEYYQYLDKLLNKLGKRKEYIHQLIKHKEDVSITIYIRSDFGQIGYSLPDYIISKLALLQCPINFDIISFGLVSDEEG